MEFVPVMCLLGYCLLLTRFFKLAIETTPFITISSLIVLLYVAAYCHLLLISTYLILIVGGCGLLLAPFYLKCSKQLFLENYATPGFLLPMTIILIFAFVSSLIVHFSYFDETWFWVPHATLLFSHNGFYPVTDTIIHPSYPLGSALFYYSFLQLTGWSQGVFYFAQTLLLLLPLLLFFQKLRWNQWETVVITFFILLLILVAVGHLAIVVRGDLRMDVVIGIFFGSSMVYYLLSARDVNAILWLTPVMGCLMLLKLKLLPFVIIIAAIIFLDQVIRFQKWREFLKSMAAVLLLIIAAGIIQDSWYHYLRIMHIELEWRMPALNVIIQGFIPQTMSEKTSQTLSTFIDKMDAPMIFLLSIGYFLLWAYKNIENYQEKMVFTMVQIILFLGFIGYLLSLFIMHCYLFGYNEGIHMPAFERYSRTYEIGWVMVIFSYFSVILKNYLAKIPSNVKIRVMGIIAIGFVMIGIFVRIFSHNIT